VGWIFQTRGNARLLARHSKWWAGNILTGRITHLASKPAQNTLNHVQWSFKVTDIVWIYVQKSFIFFYTHRHDGWQADMTNFTTSWETGNQLPDREGPSANKHLQITNCSMTINNWRTGVYCYTLAPVFLLGGVAIAPVIDASAGLGGHIATCCCCLSLKLLFLNSP